MGLDEQAYLLYRVTSVIKRKRQTTDLHRLYSPINTENQKVSAEIRAESVVKKQTRDWHN